MKTGFKIVVTVIVVAALTVAGGSAFFLQNSPENRNPRVTPSPQETATPTQTATALPTPTAEPTITITYHSSALDCGRQCAEITIQNQGYVSFSTNPEKFHINMNGKTYAYSQTYTPQFGDWTNKTMAENASYSGVLIFNTPKSSDPFTINYDDANYNIVYVSN